MRGGPTSAVRQRDPRLSVVQPQNYAVERDGEGEGKKSCFLALIGFEGCARAEHDTDSCSLLAIDKTLKPGDQFVAESVSLCLHDPQEERRCESSRWREMREGKRAAQSA